ncbi:MAG: DUF6491 family protein [Gammaproteobacteria bacterium]|nr:DUF6491 family protein [Gammaproteobacteria bacterium]
MSRAVAACVAAALCLPLWAGEDAAGTGEDPGSGPAEEATEEAAEERDLEAIIAAILDVDAVEEYDTSENCIPRSRISRTEILNERFVVFHLRGDEKYLVQFRHRCPGLRRNGTMRLETRSFRLCSMDTIQGFYEMGIGRGTWGPSCMIPGFEPVTREQVAIIKEELRRPR